MAWMATTSYTTLSITDISHGIAYKNLKAGDAVCLRQGQRILSDPLRPHQELTALTIQASEAGS